MYDNYKNDTTKTYYWFICNLMSSAYTLLMSFASELPLFWMEGISWKDCTRKLLVPALALTIDSTSSVILSGWLNEGSLSLLASGPWLVYFDHAKIISTYNLCAQCDEAHFNPYLLLINQECLPFDQQPMTTFVLFCLYSVWTEDIFAKGSEIKTSIS